MLDLIVHPDRPDEYLRMEIMVVQNDDADPRIEGVIDSRYIANDAVSQRLPGCEVERLDLDDPAHVAAFAALRAIGLRMVQSRAAALQAAREARLKPGE